MGHVAYGLQYEESATCELYGPEPRFSVLLHACIIFSMIRIIIRLQSIFEGFQVSFYVNYLATVCQFRYNHVTGYLVYKTRVAIVYHAFALIQFNMDLKMLLKYQILVEAMVMMLLSSHVESKQYLLSLNLIIIRSLSELISYNFSCMSLYLHAYIQCA